MYFSTRIQTYNRVQGFCNVPCIHFTIIIKHKIKLGSYRCFIVFSLVCTLLLPLFFPQQICFVYGKIAEYSVFFHDDTVIDLFTRRISSA